jgi:hypothetical protein
MKHLFVLAASIAFTVASAPVLAQTASSEAGSTAVSGSASQSGSISYNGGNTINFPAVPSKQTTEYTGKYKVESAPAVSAPAVFGGGHPCLAGSSGGISVIGGGASFGTGTAEPICMLWLMNQPEAAIRLLAMQSADACKAMGNVGYYRVGNQVLPFECGKQVVVGGIDSPGAKPRTSRVSTRNEQQPTDFYRRCEMKGDKVSISYTGLGRANKEIANKYCLAQLGY